MDKRKEAFITDLLKIIKQHGSQADENELCNYALLRFQVACAEASLSRKSTTKPKVKSTKLPYFSLSNVLGIDLIGFWNFLFILTAVVTVCGVKFGYYDPVQSVIELSNQKCLVQGGDLLSEMVRAPVNCEMCRNLVQVPIETNITQEKFLQEYAYSAKPVVIKNAISGWKALGRFNLKFFKDLYKSHNEAFKVQSKEGQFFGYNTEFNDLKEALTMSEERQLKPWYFGWSNAHPEVGEVLRTFYEKPSFLPSDAESSRIDWMFMGVSGKGAPLHLDYVSRPSWQAQVSGTKSWRLVPSPECANVCHSLNVTVHPGDIINVDTTRWYHSTFIHQGDISCTIGSEYD